MAHPHSNGHCIDLELAFINSLAEKMNAKALRGYCEGTRKRSVGFDGRPMNEGARSQLLARAEMHLTAIGETNVQRGVYR